MNFPFPGPPQAQPATAPQIPFQPVPTTVSVSAVMFGATSFVQMVFQNLTGVSVFFFDADSALQFAGQVRQIGRSAKSGLTLPDGVNLNGHGEDDATP